MRRGGVRLPLQNTTSSTAGVTASSAAAFTDLYPGDKHSVPFTFKGEAIYYN
jgi:raffinose/stachyose/melibiose transport system substrate-binding protein